MRRIAIIAAIAAFAALAASAGAQGAVLYGTRSGLFKKAASGPSQRLWGPGEVKKILKTQAGWFLLSSKGVIHSDDLSSFDGRNSGLPVKILKTFTGDRVGFEREIQDLKDLEADPFDPLTMVSCSKDEIFLTRDGGASWRRIASPAEDVTGLKAVTVYSIPELTVLVSHPIKGVYSMNPDDARPAWSRMDSGLERMGGSEYADEIADLKAEDAGGSVRVWASGSFLPEIYVYDPLSRSFKKVIESKKDFGMVESLCPLPGGGMGFVSDGGLGSIPSPGRQVAALEATPWKEARDIVLRVQAEAGSDLEALWFRDASGADISLNELWLLDRSYSGQRAGKAAKRQGIYLPTGFVNTKLDDYAKLLQDKGLNMLTVDMKDDFGKLRFRPQGEYLKSIGKVSSPIDVEAFVKAMKARGIYLVARIVVFKDQVVFENGGGRYAVWDSKEGVPWRGYDTEILPSPSPTPAYSPILPSDAPFLPAKTPAPPSPRPAGPQYYRDYNAEYWVDPYCEWVWKYNVEIAKEIVARGFDEVQFDYIRFPTDGENLRNASYRFKGEGMDKESALMSFLSYARESVDAPISADIYGANGWYRTGVRTGQDVELLARYVDAVCPMFYPSHFEQGFYAMPPAVQRPYRIYYYGTLRNTYIGRFRLVVRPYVQAFWMNVKYDREYYGPDYVKLEVSGVRDSADAGMTFWNASGRYDDLPDLRTVLAAQTPRAMRVLD